MTDQIKNLKELCNSFKGTEGDFTCCDFANVASQAIPKLITTVENADCEREQMYIQLSEARCTIESLERCIDNDTKVHELETKLAQAVEVLGLYAKAPHNGVDNQARTLLDRWSVYIEKAKVVLLDEDGEEE